MTVAVPMTVRKTTPPHGNANHGVEPVQPQNLDDELNKVAREGWELVTVVSSTPSVSHKFGVGGVPLLIHYFRRVKA